MMFSHFTNNYKELILAINTGSMGTLISTMVKFIFKLLLYIIL